MKLVMNQPILQPLPAQRQLVANIDILFERAIIKVTHDDKKNRINVEHVHRLGSIILDESTGAYVPVMITVIEYKHLARISGLTSISDSSFLSTRLLMPMC